LGSRLVTILLRLLVSGEGGLSGALNNLFIRSPGMSDIDQYLVNPLSTFTWYNSSAGVVAEPRWRLLPAGPSGPWGLLEACSGLPAPAPAPHG
jgi:hypothetical protein